MQLPKYNLFTEIGSQKMFSQSEELNEDSLRQKRIERGLTYKQNMNNQPNQKVRRRQSIPKIAARKQSSPIQSSNRRRDSMREKNIDLSFDFAANDPQSKIFDTGKLTK